MSSRDVKVEIVGGRYCRVTWMSPEGKAWALKQFFSSRPRQVSLWAAPNMIAALTADGLTVSPPRIRDDIRRVQHDGLAGGHDRSAASSALSRPSGKMEAGMEILLKEWETELKKYGRIRHISEILISLILMIEMAEMVSKGLTSLQHWYLIQ